MHHRHLGKNGPKVSAMGLGCMGMSEFYGYMHPKESVKVLHRAVDLGCTFWDSSDMYGVGLNEVLLSRVLSERRSEVFLCTKFGNVRGNDGSFLPVNGKPDYVKRACDMSLLRLGVDVIDLYYQHRVDPEVPIEETVGAMSDLVKAGKVRCLGLSEAGPKTIRRAHKVHPITAGQYEYSLWTREVEAEVLPTLRELGIGLVAYSPLGRGFLTGQYKDPSVFSDPADRRVVFPRFQGENLEHNRQWLKKIEDIAAANKCTPGQLALAWVLAKGEDIIPIPGTRRIPRLEENLAALEIRLSPETIRELDAVGEVKGTRYPAYSIGTTMKESI